MVVDLYEYYNVPFGPDYGRKFSPSGVTHLLLFDCPKSSDAKDVTGLNSPILAQVKSALVDEYGVHVHANPSSRPSGLLKLHHQVKWLTDFLGSKRLNDAFRFTYDKPHLIKQTMDGYRCLVECYNIGDISETRDRVFLLGDGDGALCAAAAAAAQMIRRVGVLRDNAVEIKGLFEEAYRASAYDSISQAACNSFRALRSDFARVELLGLCYDANQRLLPDPIKEDNSFIGKVAEFNRLPCAACAKMTDSKNTFSCPARHMIEAIKST